MTWIAISKTNNARTFYPANLIGNRLDTRLNYIQAREKSLSYFKGKNIYFHMCWAFKHYDIWKEYYKDIASVAKSFWIEFDADMHLNTLETIDMGTEVPFLIPSLADVTDKFIWEVPIRFNPFIGDTYRLPLRMYDKSMEHPIGDKDIDVLCLIDHAKRNASNSLRVLQKLNENYYVKCISLSDKIVDMYQDKVNFTIIKNTKFNDKGQARFHKLLKRSKVFLDLTSRITAGRNIYEALYFGNIVVASDTYGAMDILFPENRIGSTNIDVNVVVKTCTNRIETWSENKVEEFRDRARKFASIDDFVKELKSYGD